MAVFSKKEWRKSIPALLLLSAFAAGYSPSAQAGIDGPTTDRVFQEAKEKAEEFDALGWPPAGRFKPFPELTKAYADFNRRLWVDYGVLYGLTPTLMMQAGTQGGGNNFTVNEQYQGLFGWRAFHDMPFGTGIFVFNNLHVGQLTNTTGVNLSQSLGVNYFVSDSVGDTDVIKALLWRQDLPGDRVTVFAGHDSLSDLIGGCRYACDDTTSFLSTPLSADPARTLPGQGTMISAAFKLVDNVTVEGGIADALGDGNLNFRRVFQKGDLAYGGALKVENPFKSKGDGVYKVGFFHVDTTRAGTPQAQRATGGIALSADQDFGDFGVFAKYSRAFERKGSIEQYAGGGLMWNNPFGYDEDVWGAGLGWVDPTAPNTKDEFVAETFYRMQLTPLVLVSPAAMLVMNPSNSANGNINGVFTFRVRAVF